MRDQKESKSYCAGSIIFLLLLSYRLALSSLGFSVSSSSLIAEFYLVSLVTRANVTKWLAERVTKVKGESREKEGLAAITRE